MIRMVWTRPRPSPGVYWASSGASRSSPQRRLAPTGLTSRGWRMAESQLTPDVVAQAPDVTQADVMDEEALVSAPWPQLDPTAYHGLAGTIVRTIAPHTEADPVAILLQFLTMFGNLVGHTPYFPAEAAWHYLNLFVCLV